MLILDHNELVKELLCWFTRFATLSGSVAVICMPEAQVPLLEVVVTVTHVDTARTIVCARLGMREAIDDARMRSGPAGCAVACPNVPGKEACNKLVTNRTKPYETPSFVQAGRYAGVNYELTTPAEVVAVTGHSTVHKSYSKLFDRVVAIKIIDKSSIPNGLADKFLPRELDVTRAAKHPHIVRCLHIAQPNPSKFIIVSEFCAGGTLLKYVQDFGGLNEREAARLFRQLVEAIHYLHDTLTVAHRDIKLENILLDSLRTVKLADFGFARITKPAQRSVSFCGTKPYSSPEIVAQKPYNPFAADWYASGVVLYTMLTGKWPHEPKEKCSHPLRYPPHAVSQTARDLIAKLMDLSEETRARYPDVVQSEWMLATTDGKWIIADELFVYDVA